MDLSFWSERWKSGQINFHEGHPNQFLERHVAHLGAPGRTVLVPLCGKSEDMAFLAAQGHRVVGIEAVEAAAHAFFDEHKLTAEVSPRGAGVVAYSGGPITILVGDIFSCTADVVGPVDALYDRAALIALSPDDRKRYVPLLRTLLAPRAKGLLISISYDATRVTPPPHSVPEEEVRLLWAGATVTALDETLFENARMREAKISAVERVYGVELPG